jgi:hypothetical protein
VQPRRPVLVLVALVGESIALVGESVALGRHGRELLLERSDMRGKDQLGTGLQ